FPFKLWSTQSPAYRYVELQFVPKVDGEPKPAMINKPAPKVATERKISLEPEPRSSDKVHDPAARRDGGCASGERRYGGNPALCNTAWGELRLRLEDFDINADMPL
ncbi:hypothetical protein M9458_057026, partial [Cirrhinus mrigala]